MNSQICELEHLTQEALLDLIHHRCMAVHIPDYYDNDTARKIAEKLCKSSLFGKYENAPNIARVGQAYFEGYASEEAAERYRTKSREWNRQLRKECLPYILPIDRVRLDLDEAWDYGAKLGNVPGDRNLKAFAGLARIFSEGSGTEVHLDELNWDLPTIDKSETEVMNQFAVNVYLQLPSAGGEVKLWKRRLTKKEYDSMRNHGSYGVNPEKLPDPDLIFTPKQGDLWLFRASELHQVIESGKGQRVTQSCFVGFRGEDKHLVIWS